jgi:hypothetical protein
MRDGAEMTAAVMDRASLRQPDVDNFEIAIEIDETDTRARWLDDRRPSIGDVAWDFQSAEARVGGEGDDLYPDYDERQEVSHCRSGERHQVRRDICPGAPAARLSLRDRVVLRQAR